MKTKIIKMKNTIPFILLFLSFGLMAQQKSHNTNFVILTSQFDQLESIVMAANDDNRDGEIQVVFYGSEVKKLTTRDMRKYLELGENFEVIFLVCQMSLDRLKIEPDSIPKEIKVVANAFLYSFQLQKKGYKSLTL